MRLQAHSISASGKHTFGRTDDASIEFVSHRAFNTEMIDERRTSFLLTDIDGLTERVPKRPCL